jgi:peroxiredoxin
MSLAVGEKAPDFELVGTDPEPFRLSKQIGQKHTVLAFYELAFNNDCTDEMLAFQELLDQFDAAGASIVGISLDPKGILDSFAGSNGLEFTLLSDDFTPRVCSLYGAWREDRGFASNTGGMARRMTYVIDKQGVVRGVIEDVPPAEHAEKALDVVRGL